MNYRYPLRTLKLKFLADLIALSCYKLASRTSQVQSSHHLQSMSAESIDGYEELPVHHLHRN